MFEDNKRGAGGWPLVPSRIYPGELTLACPKCGSTDIILTCEYPSRGTGPGGRGRLGDAGTREVNQCRTCKFIHTFDALERR